MAIASYYLAGNTSAWNVTRDGTVYSNCNGASTSQWSVQNLQAGGGRSHVFVQGQASQTIQVWWHSSGNTANASLVVDVYTAADGTAYTLKDNPPWTKGANLLTLPVAGPNKAFTTFTVTMPNPAGTKLDIWVNYAGGNVTSMGSINCLTTNY